MDTQIGKVQRCVCEPSVAPLWSFLTRISIAEAGTSRSRFTRLRPSSVRCWRLSVSRRSAGESIRGQGTTSQRQRERRSSSRSRHELACVHYTFCLCLPTLPIEAGNCLYTLPEDNQEGEEQVHCINSSQRADGTRINKRIYIQTLWPNAFDRPAAASCSLASSMSSLKEPSGLLDRAFQSLIHTFRQCQCRRLEFHERTRLTTKRAYTTLVSFIF